MRGCGFISRKTWDTSALQVFLRVEWRVMVGAGGGLGAEGGSESELRKITYFILHVKD